MVSRRDFSRYLLSSYSNHADTVKSIICVDAFSPFMVNIKASGSEVH